MGVQVYKRKREREREIVREGGREKKKEGKERKRRQMKGTDEKRVTWVELLSRERGRGRED